MNGRARMATQVAHELFIGDIPKGTENIRHTCDNPGCVNPEHLIAGTVKENAADREGRDRGNHPSKLTDHDVLWIRWFHANGKASYREIGRAFRIRWDHVRDVVKRKAWKHLK